MHGHIPCRILHIVYKLHKWNFMIRVGHVILFGAVEVKMA
jgi:hypothetical protein